MKMVGMEIKLLKFVNLLLQPYFPPDPFWTLGREKKFTVSLPEIEPLLSRFKSYFMMV
jgi:hypothetical protein